MNDKNTVFCLKDISIILKNNKKKNIKDIIVIG